MPNSIFSSLDSIIQDKNLSVFFQPIIENTERNIFGYEALIRGPSNSQLHSPIALFSAATSQGRLVELELLCRELSILQFKKLDLKGKLFLNASPETLFQPNFRSGQTLKLLKKIGLDPSRVVIELTEHSPLENYEVIRDALKHYKKMGFEIAMDDLGAGYSGLRTWYEVRPDFVKIDRHFMCNIDSDKVKQHFVLSIKKIAQELGCKVIAEGVESVNEFRFIEKIGLQFCQGYYFSRPEPLPLRSINNNLFSERRLTVQSKNRLVSSKMVGELLQPIDAISTSTTIESCATLFKQAPELDSIPVLEKNKPIGLIHRNNLTNLFFSAYGRELSGRKTIASLVDRNVLILENDLPVEQASILISAQVGRNKILEFIIVEKGEYQGVGSIIDLLKEITNLQINNARYANPLSLLPGNVPISKNLDQRLREEASFTVCYIDLDHFKPYNDYYGYEKGDQILLGVADILRNIVTDRDDFIGHIGGDDFIVILSYDHWRTQCEKILSDFSQWVRHCYSQEDQRRGGITGEDRSGGKQFYPLLSLSIGCVNLSPAVCKSHNDVAVLASEAKSMAKKINGNSLYVYNSKTATNRLPKKTSNGIMS
ncbi:MAG: EAL domain-containing protein (putative c-di-GMP-specific phosphodiesterase class I) [Psychromonas sp.]|jgi:EAL domain-containing protein (putative c-di-GMP-specific phosphodiesterase class I)/GGDEF domain-containing protein/predicted transcriptional regulator|uniref:GGDEF domain-containing protein n=1 Tax=Psychromonas sp. TaxID=1884585 RepID=UPI0039E4D339